jgi:hypothetical protein
VSPGNALNTPTPQSGLNAVNASAPAPVQR